DRHARFGRKPDSAPRRAVAELPLDDVRSGIASGARPARPARSRDRPREVGLDRRRRLVEIVAVETEPRLETQRVARTEPGGRDIRMREQRARDPLRFTRRHRDLEAVLAGVTGPA